MTMTLTTPSTEQLREMSPAEFVGALREVLRRPGGGMADHPAVLAIEAGTMTTSQMALWTEQFYLHIRNMLPWIGQFTARCPLPEVSKTLVKNYAEEVLGVFTNTGPHPDLLLRFGEAVGLDPDKARHAEQLPVSRRLTEYFEFMSMQREWFVPLAAIGIGLESFVPDTFRRLVAAFKANYHLIDEQLIFWTMHIVADEEHGDEGIELVSEYVRDAEQRKVVFDCTVETGERFYDMWNIYTAAD